MNLGAGAIVKQDLARIDDAIADGSFFENEALLAACKAARESPRGRLHLMGLVSDGGVHSGWEHIEALIELAAREGVPDLVVHAFTDGRDTLPESSAGYIPELERWLRHAGRVGTVSGRYYAMDRDTRWERTKLAYDALVHAQGVDAATAEEAVKAAHDAGETDEFIKPAVIGDYDGMAPGDVLIHFNFRPDRTRQLVRALAEPDFDEFSRSGAPEFELTTLTQYREGWPYPIAFPPKTPETTLAEVLAEAGADTAPRRRDREVRPRHLLLQRRARGGVGGEERRLVESPRDVATYDEKPEMSARAAADAFIDGWKDASPRFGILNFANPDMVGHSGVIPAAVERDRGRGRVPRPRRRGGARERRSADRHRRPRQRRQHARARRLAEHGALHEPGAVHRHRAGRRALDDGGILADVAPTALALLGIDQPDEMTGRSLLSSSHARRPRPPALRDRRRATAPPGPERSTPRTARSRRRPSSRWPRPAPSEASTPTRSRRSATRWSWATRSTSTSARPRAHPARSAACTSS